MIGQPDELAEMVATLRRDLDELKSAGQRVGYDSLVTYKTATAAAHDIAVTVPVGQVREYLVEFAHDRAKDGALLVLNPYYRVNNPAVMANPVARNAQTNAVSWAKVASDGDSTTWRLRIENEAVTTGFTVYVKLFVDGTDSGAFSITAI